MLVGYQKLWSGLGINFSESKKYVLKETYEDTPQRFRGLYVFNNKFVRLDWEKNVNKQEADNLVKTKLNSFLGLFENEIAPYPGEVSKVISCDGDLKPKLININGTDFYVGFLNSRLQFGSCNKDQLVYRGLIGHLYCPKSRSFYQVEYFFDKNLINQEREIESFISSLKCR